MKNDENPKTKKEGACDHEIVSGKVVDAYGVQAPSCQFAYEPAAEVLTTAVIDYLT